MLKNFIIRFESGVIVIKHWRMHNTLRKDRYTPTSFQEELKSLGLNENGSYTLGCHLVDNGLPQDSIGKDSIIVSKKVSKNIEINNITSNTRTREELPSYEQIMEEMMVEEPSLKRTLFEFIKHCQLNKHLVTNKKLSDIIIRLDFAFGDDYVAKNNCLTEAINKGYYDIKTPRDL